MYLSEILTCLLFRHNPNCAFLNSNLGRRGVQEMRQKVPPEPREHVIFTYVAYVGDEPRRQDPAPSPPVEESTPCAQHAQSSLAQSSSAQCARCVCCVPLDKQRDVLLYPCKHLVVCAECAQCLRRCPLCRGLISSSGFFFFFEYINYLLFFK